MDPLGRSNGTLRVSHGTHWRVGQFSTRSTTRVAIGHRRGEHAQDDAGADHTELRGPVHGPRRRCPCAAEPFEMHRRCSADGSSHSHYLGNDSRSGAPGVSWAAHGRKPLRWLVAPCDEIFLWSLWQIPHASTETRTCSGLASTGGRSTRGSSPPDFRDLRRPDCGGDRWSPWGGGWVVVASKPVVAQRISPSRSMTVAGSPARRRATATNFGCQPKNGSSRTWSQPPSG
jgi:hypothetical protein